MHLSRRYGRTAFVYSRAPDWNKPVPPSHTAGEGKVRSVKKLFVLMAAVLALVTVPASAQDTTGGVAGRIVDSSGLALPGVTVAATGAQGAKTAVSDAEGRYTIPFLIPGVYMIDLTLDGFEPVHRGGIHIELGQALDVSLTMRVGGVTETVQVTANRPLVDTTSAAIGANLDGETLSRLPVGRRFSDTLYVAPGVSTGGAVGAANPSVEGSSGLENQYVIDGVNVTNGGYGALGSYSVVFGSLGNGTPYDFIEQVQVKTGGYEAEFGQATGGVINVVTKSGANDLRGSAFAYVRPHALESTYRTVQTTERYGQHRRRGQQRCRRGNRRPARPRSPVLLRRGRSAVAAEHVPRARRLSP